MDQGHLNWIANFMWGIPDDVLRGLYVRGSFTRHFHRPTPLRTLEEIRADILALEKETEELLGEILGRSASP